jgi:hypothetical protein
MISRHSSLAIRLSSFSANFSASGGRSIGFAPPGRWAHSVEMAAWMLCQRGSLIAVPSARPNRSSAAATSSSFARMGRNSWSKTAVAVLELGMA